MKLADQIILHLMRYGRRDPNEIMIPNFYHLGYEMDVFKLTKEQLVVEYEVKISRSDFFNDFKKYREYGAYRTEYGAYHTQTHSWPTIKNVYKHDQLREGHGPNRFVFVVPDGLVEPHEVPSHCGLMYFTTSEHRITTIRPAKLLHTKKFNDFKQLAKSLSWREEHWRRKCLK